MTHFFDASWTCLGRSEALLSPGSRTAVRAGHSSILLTRDEAGVLRGFFNICRHRGHELLPVGGSASGPLMECPYHGWTYRDDGSLKSAPRLGYRPGFAVRDHGLVPLRIDEWQGWVFANVSGAAPALGEHLGNLEGLMASWAPVFANVSGAAPPLGEHLGNLEALMASWAPRDLVEVSRMDYTVEANWKLLHENYHECYHCPEIHPELCRVSPPTSGLNLDTTGMWIGGWMDLAEDAETMSLNGRGGAPALPGLTLEERHRVYYFGLFPNLLISPHPDYVLSHRIEPLAPTRSRVECRTLFRREVVEKKGIDLDYGGQFWDVTNRQDWAAIESIQRSAASPGFRPGPIAEMEEAVYQFFNMVPTGYVSGRPVVPRNPTTMLA
jgi:Rieske 2Fe-2S family protein